MRASTIHRAIGFCIRGSTGARAALVVLTLLASGCAPGSVSPRPPQERLRTGVAAPHHTHGAPYPAAAPSHRPPNEEENDLPPVPTGPRVGNMRPSSPRTITRSIAESQGRLPTARTIAYHRDAPPPPPALVFRDYHELTGQAASTSGCCPEVSVAENGATIMMTGNYWFAFSEDGGASFANINPTTLFPEDDGGFCCDQVITYVPQHDLFVWLLQYWADAAGNNRIRIAAQTTAQARASNGTDWTFWDFLSDDFDPDATLDRNDVAVGDQSLWWSTQVEGSGRVVVRIPLADLAAQDSIGFAFTGPTDAPHAHLTQNAANTVYWAGHASNSEMRVYSMTDGEGVYGARSVTVNSWPNGTSVSECPGGSNWMEWEKDGHAVFGNALQRGEVWFAWLAAAGGGFPQPHVQMVRIDPFDWSLKEQVQIWHPTIAFQDAYLTTNSAQELGMEIAFGGGGYFPSSASGVWGDFVLYYPRLSSRCSPTGRWGDYNHARRSGLNGAQWVGAGYTMETNAAGANIMLPHYVRFSR